MRKQLAVMILLATCTYASEGSEPLWAASAIPLNQSGELMVYTSMVCAGSGNFSVQAGTVLHEFHSRGIVILDGKSLTEAIDNMGRRSVSTILLDVSEAVALGGTLVTSTDAVKMREPVRKKLTFSLAIFAGLSHWLHTKLEQKRTPDTKLREYVLPVEIKLERAQQCWSGLLVGLPHAAASFEVK